MVPGNRQEQLRFSRWRQGSEERLSVLTLLICDNVMIIIVIIVVIIL